MSKSRSNSAETDQEVDNTNAKGDKGNENFLNNSDENANGEKLTIPELNNTESKEKNDNEKEGNDEVPSSPPPSYEFVLEEKRLKQQQGAQSPKAPEIMHKSSKEFYKAVAKQFGITCKMSDHCRCYDCQSHYFDCEYEQNEQEKTDGGLGAGTPVFLQEVMHGTACTIL
ncbi:uncharacterized protein LOC143194999 [Rhynchophorus ferrugineus]|uniref:DUF4802 domain-containing protein n=1 Tax=Rhynchophorus ferrugineus TaxID=354439 RepID=A0A834IRB3_RHYFE|nr:hypothetical protein GWI33_008236 [Rhynchophorus ferrugineus]